MKKRKCLGYGDTIGACQKDAGSVWSEHWCPQCDKKRLDKISNQFKDLLERYEEIDWGIDEDGNAIKTIK